MLNEGVCWFTCAFIPLALQIHRFGFYLVIPLLTRAMPSTWYKERCVRIMILVLNRFCFVMLGRSIQNLLYAYCSSTLQWGTLCPQCRPKGLTTSLVLMLLLKVCCKRLSIQIDSLVAQAIPPFGKYGIVRQGLRKSVIGRVDSDASKSMCGFENAFFSGEV